MFRQTAVHVVVGGLTAHQQDLPGSPSPHVHSCIEEHCIWKLSLPKTQHF